MNLALEITSQWEQELIDAIGEEATLKLEQAFPSCYFYVSKKGTN